MTGKGILGIFHDAGAMVIPAGCAPCVSGRTGLINSGATSISTTVANGVGRFGTRDAQLYLGSPATVAASAATGRITDPREFL